MSSALRKSAKLLTKNTFLKVPFAIGHVKVRAHVLYKLDETEIELFGLYAKY